MKKICNLKDEDYRLLLVDTLEEISDTVSSTLGPNGKTCILYDGGAIPHVTKDGVTVAEFLQFRNPFKEAINKIVKETARKTGEKVGDGTTTSILLACELAKKVFSEAVKNNNILGILTGVEVSVEKVLAGIKKDIVKLDVFDDETVNILRSIVHMSSNGDKEITDIISDILHSIGADGVIDVKESNSEITTYDILEGMLLETPTNVVKTTNISRPYVALVSTPIEKIHQIKSLLMLSSDLYRNVGRPTIVIAKEFGKEVLDIVTVNNRNNKTAVYLVESDGFALNRYTLLDDMAALLNCKILSTDNTSEFGLQNVVPEHLSDNVLAATISPHQTILQSDKFLTAENLETKQSIINEIAELKRTGESKIGELSLLYKRLSKFSKSATIYVGGLTDAEKYEKRDRVDDAVKALESAVNGGVVPGGGYTIYKNSLSIKNKIVKDVCKLPATLLSQNLDSDVFEIFKDGNVVDYVTGEFGDPMKLGVLDPANVLIKALQQAMAIVKLLVNTHAIIIPDEI